VNIEKLKLENFRNLEKSVLEPDSNVNIIFGDNAQGKTNILEAIWIFTGGRSFRNTKDLDLINFKETFSKLEISLFTENRTQNLKIELSKPKRKVYVNDVLKHTPSDYVGKFCSVIFSPTHLSLIKDGPQHRRRFLDAAICQINPTYAKRLTIYNHILNQRNQLLKSIKAKPNLEDTLFVWNDRLSKEAAVIISLRLQYVNLLKEYTKSIYKNFTKEKENLSLSYFSNSLSKDLMKKSENEEEEIDIEEISEYVLTRLRDVKNEETILGYTTVGPHRDDFEIYINNKKAKIFASQGQQRSAVLSLKLAESEIVEKNCKKTPVILLDDVMSELDSQRQDFILNSISNRQVFITCCDPTSLTKMTAGKTYEVKSGRIT